jgi:cleavage and polyadenylation specificity factor subunit 2
MFNFTPLLGAQSTSPASQSLLEFDGGVKVLIDVGWDESFDTEKLREIEKYVVNCERRHVLKGHTIRVYTFIL